LQRLTATLAQRQMQQRYNQMRMALQQQQIMQRAAVEQAQIQHFNAMTQHQQSVDHAADEYAHAVGARANGLDFMMNGPTIDDANKMALSRELASRAMVRGLRGDVDNPPTGTVNPGQERINTMTGDVLGYLPPNPTFHSVPAGGTPYVLDNGQAMQQGPQTGFRPNVARSGIPTFHPGSQYSAPYVFDPNQGALIPVNEGGGTNAPTFGKPLRYDDQLSNAVKAGAQKSDEVIQQAQDAIAKGADKQKVNQRLQQMGYDPIP